MRVAGTGPRPRHRHSRSFQEDPGRRQVAPSRVVHAQPQQARAHAVRGETTTAIHRERNWITAAEQQDHRGGVRGHQPPAQGPRSARRWLHHQLDPAPVRAEPEPACLDAGKGSGWSPGPRPADRSARRPTRGSTRRAGRGGPVDVRVVDQRRQVGRCHPLGEGRLGRSDDAARRAIRPGQRCPPLGELSHALTSPVRPPRAAPRPAAAP